MWSASSRSDGVPVGMAVSLRTPASQAAYNPLALFIQTVGSTRCAAGRSSCGMLGKTALTSCAVLYIWSAVHLALGARTLGRDLARQH